MARFSVLTCGRNSVSVLSFVFGFWRFFSCICFSHSVLFFCSLLSKKPFQVKGCGCFSCTFLAVQDQIVVHVNVAVNLKKRIQNILCMDVWSCLCSACLLKMLNVLCEYMLHPRWALCKSTTVFDDNQCSNERKTGKEFILSLGQWRGKLAF